MLGSSDVPMPPLPAAGGAVAMSDVMPQDEQYAHTYVAWHLSEMVMA